MPKMIKIRNRKVEQAPTDCLHQVVFQDLNFHKVSSGEQRPIISQLH